MIEAGHFIDGRECEATSRDRFECLAPETGSRLGFAARGDAVDVDAAVASSRRAFAPWSGLAAREREAALLAAADRIASEGEDRLLDLLIDESGSTINKARGEIAYSADLIRAAAGEARRLYGDTFPNDRADRLSFVIREPVGVVGIVSPYNAPLALLVKMTAFPLAAGNTVVVKPSEETPLIAVALAKMLHEAGLPAGAFNVVTGFGAECGAPLVDHPDVDAIALTGSTKTGRRVGAAAMNRARRIQLELGGKNPLLVLRDADPVEAAKIAVQGLFAHAGQICMANSRIIVEAPIYDAFAAAIKTEAEQLKLGDLRDPATAYGPLINKAAVDKVAAQQAEAVAGGASVLTGGEIANGLVYRPTLLTDVPRDCELWCEESFGPIGCLVKAADLDDAIAIANDTDYGLSGAVLTGNTQWGFQAARRIRAGSVHIGMHAFQSNSMAPIGGYGLSGLGRSGGKYSTEEFTELKWISVETGSLPDGS